MSSELKHPDFHARLAEVIGQEKPYAWADRVGINKATFHRIWNEGTIPGPDHLRRIREVTGFSIDWLLTGEGPKRRDATPTEEPVKDGGLARFAKADELRAEYVLVPRYDVQASAGGGALVHSEQIVDFLAFKAEWVKNALGVTAKELVLISVIGDSMEPSLSDGDLILVNTSTRRVEDNAVYALQYGGSLIVKRIQRRLDGSLIIKSDNIIYTPEEITSEKAEQLKVIGRVVWAGGRM